MSEITQVDNAKDLDVAISMYNLMGHSNYYSKSPGSLWRYCRDEADGKRTDSKSFEFKCRWKCRQVLVMVVL